MSNKAQTKYVEKAIERTHVMVEEFYEQVESIDKTIKKDIESIKDEKMRNVLSKINSFYKMNIHDLNAEILYIAHILESMRLNDPHKSIMKFEKRVEKKLEYAKWLKKALDDESKDTAID